MLNSLEIILFGYSLELWEILAVIAVFLSAMEVFIPGFVLLPIGLAFGITALAAIFLTSWLAVLTCLGLSLFFMVWLFSKKIKSIKSKCAHSTNMSGLIGQELKVAKAFSSGDYGEAKVYGDNWTIYSKSGTAYKEGAKTKVLSVDGNKLVVE